MKKLTRDPNGPPCLARYRHGVQNWDDVTNEDKEEIRAHLARMQGRICAYCEGPLDELGQHIEHFRPRHTNATLTFAWSNLFWSCMQEDSCGQYKDTKGKPYDANDLIDPSLHDPDRFLKFRSNGTIEPRSKLSPSERHRAEETLRVFNLQQERGRLTTMRRKSVLPYLRDVEDIGSWPPALRDEYIQSELQARSHEPFFTVIKHFFLTTP